MYILQSPENSWNRPRMANTHLSTTTPEYLTLQKRYRSIVLAVKADLGCLCDILFSKSLIPMSIKNYTQMDSVFDEDKARKVIDNVMNRIELDPGVFHEFVEALNSPHFSKLKETLNECYQTLRKETDCPKVKPSSSDNSSITKPSPREISGNAKSVHTSSSQPNSDISFVCPYCKNCSLEKYLSDEGCPEATGRTLFPYLNTQSLSEEDRMELEQSLVLSAQDLRQHFAFTDTYIAENLHADVTLVKNFVLDLVRNGKQKENIAKIEEADSISNIILALQPYKSFLNYDIIESIASKFGSTEICAEMQKYVTAFTEFCKRSAFEVPFNVLKKKVENGNEKVISVKLTKEDKDSLEKVFSARRKMASILGVNKCVFDVCSIEDGCLRVRFLVPAAVMSKILPLSPDKKSALRDAGIKIAEEEITPSKASDR